MKSSHYFFNEYEYYITPSEIIEFKYCNRFTYFMKALGIQQYEEKRFKVRKGRELHDKREQENREYLRKKIGVTKKEIGVNLVSKLYGIRGKVDEVIWLSDGSLSFIDYKFAEYQEATFKTYKSQMILYALMLEEMYNINVEKSYIVYCRDGFKPKQIDIFEKEKMDIEKDIRNFIKVMGGYYPKGTSHKSKCIDCCYRNICIK